MAAVLSARPAPLDSPRLSRGCELRERGKVEGECYAVMRAHDEQVVAESRTYVAPFGRA